MGLNPMMIAGIANATLSIIGADAANRKIENQANQNFNSTLSSLNQTFGVALNGLRLQADEVNNQIGMQLTDLNYQKRGAGGQVVAANTEKNIYGQTAKKSQAVVAMSAALAEDQLQQAAESAMADLGSKMATAKYSRDAGVYQASSQRASAMSQMKSTFEIATGALQAGISGASTANTVSGQWTNSGGLFGKT
tara:strand:+ start:44 stop:625 length:582 start_codon:yes stop_codon:yes gene_type:complete